MGALHFQYFVIWDMLMNNLDKKEKEALKNEAQQVL